MLSTKERRKHARYSCEVGVEVRTENAAKGNWGSLADISLGGCYVNTFSPLPPGADVRLRLIADAANISLAGCVVTSHPGVGMGIQFKKFTTREDETKLKALVGEMAKGA